MSQSESSTTTPYKRMSSANNLTVGVRPFGRSLMSSLVALALDLQEVPLSTSHSFARQHMVCFYSSVHCPYYALLVRHVPRSAQEAWYVFSVRRATRQGLHQSLSEVGFYTLQDKHSALSSSPSFQHVRFGAFSEASILALNFSICLGPFCCYPVVSDFLLLHVLCKLCCDELWSIVRCQALR